MLFLNQVQLLLFPYCVQVHVEQKSTLANNTTTGGGTGGVAKVTAVNESQVDLLLEMLKTADITSDKEEEMKTLNDLESKEIKPKKLNL